MFQRALSPLPGSGGGKSIVDLTEEKVTLTVPHTAPRTTTYTFDKSAIMFVITCRSDLTSFTLNGETLPYNNAITNTYSKTAFYNVKAGDVLVCTNSSTANTWTFFIYIYS